MTTSAKPAPAQAEADARALRKAVRLQVSGADMPGPVARFEDALATVPAGADDSCTSRWRNTCSCVLRAVEASDWKEPTAIQMQSIPAMLAGLDVQAVAPTGSGKTAAYGVPLLASLSAVPRAELPRAAGRKRVRSGGHPPQALVLVPTRELAKQVARELARLSEGSGLRIVALTRASAAGAYGAWADALGAADAGSSAAAPRAPAATALAADSDSDEEGETAAVLARYEHMRVPLCDVLVSTPQRLCWLLDASPAEHRAPQLAALRAVVMDEVDELLGVATFVSQVDQILAAAPQSIQRCVFSATMPTHIEQLLQEVLVQPACMRVGTRGATASTVEQKLLFVGREEGKLLELQQMATQGYAAPMLIFVQSRHRAVQLLEEAAAIFGVHKVAALHGGMTEAQRDAAVADFRAGTVWILVATALVARGMDFKGVATVVNYDFPTSATEYVHRVGRTGRAGRTGKAITFFTEYDIAMLRTIANVMRQSGCEVPDWMLHLRAPTRQQKKQWAHSAPKRKAIATVDAAERRRALKKAQRKQRSSAAAASGAEADQ